MRTPINNIQQISVLRTPVLLTHGGCKDELYCITFCLKKGEKKGIKTYFKTFLTYLDAWPSRNQLLLHSIFV